MSKVVIGCAQNPEEDGTVTLTLIVSGLFQDEVDAAAPMLEEPCKEAVRLATAGRHQPGTYEHDTRTGEKKFLKPETRQ